MKAIMYPYNSPTNIHIDIIKEALEKEGIEILDYEDVYKTGNWKEIDAVYLNWFESIFNKEGMAYYKEILKRVLKLIRYKVNGVKIIYMFHNSFPHDCKHVGITAWFYKIYMKLADKIVIFSEASKKEVGKYIKENKAKNKVKHIHLPNYIGAYNEDSKAYSDVYSRDKLSLLFFGAIRPYKNIELLIDLSDKYEHIEFVIAGKAIDKDYENRLKKMISEKKVKNVKSIFSFIKDDELISLLRGADLLALPYNIKSSLNSGAALLAFSYGKTVICPKIGTISDLKNDDLVFTYSYDHRQEEIEKLSEQLKKANDIFVNNPQVFQDMGNQLKNIMIKDYNKDKIGSQLSQLLK